LMAQQVLAQSSRAHDQMPSDRPHREKPFVQRDAPFRESRVRRVTGKKISLDVQDADIREVLRLLAEASGLNIIVSPEVNGTVTMRMLDVPWEQVLDAILKLHGLAMEQSGNVLFILPLERLTAQRQEALHARQAERLGEPSITRVIPVKYAQAEALKANLEKLFGSCAAISVNVRTNSLIITGTPSCLGVR
jgi:type IV pilus assembly protein PilQ